MESNRRPRLVYVTTHATSAVGLMRGQLAMLRERGFEVILIASPSADLATAGRREQVETIAVPMEREISLWSDLLAVFRLWRELRRLKPDIVNAGTPKAGLLGSIAALLARVPARVYTLRGLRLETTSGVKRLILTAAERLAMLCSHQVLCVSPSLKDACRRLRLAPARKCIVNGAGSSNGVDLSRFERFHPDRLSDSDRQQVRQLRSMCRLPEDAPVVGFVGRLTRDKGLPELASAFRDLKQTEPNLRLLLVGDFEAGDPVPPDTVRFLRESPDVFITGFVDDVAPFYSLMTVLAFPSWREGFPNVPLEASASRLPVVGFRATGTIDAVVDGETGSLVPCGDSDALVEAVASYLHDDVKQFRHGHAALVRVRTLFPQRAVWAGLCDLYGSLLSPEQRARLVVSAEVNDAPADSSHAEELTNHETPYFRPEGVSAESSVRAA